MPELSKRIQSIIPSPISALMDRARKLSAEGRPVIDLTVGETGLPVPDEVRSAGIRSILLNETGYTATCGTPELRKKLGERYGVGPECVAVSNGAKTILGSLLTVLTDPGDEVILPAPYWSCYREMIRIAGAKETVLPCGAETSYLPTADMVRQACTDRTKAVVLNTPCNPAGTVCPGSRIREIASFCSERGIFLIVDGSYDGLTYSGETENPLSLLNAAERAVTVYVSSASKTFAMSGWRIGWCVAEPCVITALSRIFTNCAGCPSAIAQAALLKGLETYPEAPGRIREECRRRCGYVAGRIRKTGVLTCPDPEGGLYVFVRLPDGTDDLSFTEKLLEDQNIAVVPGSAFGLPGHIRIACTKPLPLLKEAMDRLDSFLAAL
ncbi:MAG: aminotransferase class I/II-fold pyridoxal phosphate-dependent enzyme [Clostridia bacterium]|nr:aminotransferase class I/II-fold pyridoxal phosphate-dependent enzyme [Clostridia bacterium]